MSPKMGRPVKSESDKKSIRLEIRMTEDEHALLMTLSDKYGLSKTDTINKALQYLAEKR